jgi:hypothetical protein
MGSYPPVRSRSAHAQIPRTAIRGPHASRPTPSQTRERCSHHDLQRKPLGSVFSLPHVSGILGHVLRPHIRRPAPLPKSHEPPGTLEPVSKLPQRDQPARDVDEATMDPVLMFDTRLQPPEAAGSRECALDRPPALATPQLAAVAELLADGTRAVQHGPIGSRAARRSRNRSRSNGVMVLKRVPARSPSRRVGQKRLRRACRQYGKVAAP